MNYDVKDAFLYIPVKVLPALITLFFVTFVFTKLTPTSYINYSIFLAISLITAQVAGGWIGNSLLFFLPTAKDNGHLIRCAALLLCVTGIGGILAAAILVHKSGGSNYDVAAAILLLVGLVTFYPLSSIYQSLGLIRRQFDSIVIQCGTQVLLVLVLFYGRTPSIASALASYGSGFLLASAFLTLNLQGALRIPQVGSNVSPQSNSLKITIREIVKYGAPLGVWFSIILLMNSVDRFFLEGIEAATQVASYLSSKDILLGGAGLISMPLLMAAHPAIIRQGLLKNQQGAEYVVRTNVELLLLLFAAYITIIQFFGLAALETLFGKKYSIATLDLVVTTVGLFFSAASMYAQKGLEVQRKTVEMVGLALCGLIVVLILSNILIPTFGVTGAATSFALANATYFFLACSRSAGIIRTKVRPSRLLLAILLWFIGLTLDYVIDATSDNRGMGNQLAWLACYLTIVIALLAFLLKQSTSRRGVQKQNED